MATGLHALVAGGTGAVGKYLVAELLASEKIAAVTVIGRRDIVFAPEKQPLAEHLQKLHYKHLNDLSDIAALKPDQLTPSYYQLGFCCLGTTQKDAGSAEAFRKIDFEAVSHFGALAKKAQVEHFQLVSSKGSNKNSYFLYTKTKGEAEEFTRSLGFKQLTIVRPPLLDRGSNARLVEKIFKYVVPSIKVGDVARGMVRQAEKVMGSGKQGEEILNKEGLMELLKQ